jgi:hypothetical protein
MVMPACRSSRSPELLQEHNNYSPSPYVPEEPFPFLPILFFSFCSCLYYFVSITEFYLDEQEKFRERMKNYVNKKKRYDLQFLRSRYANGIPKYRFYSYPPSLPCRTFNNLENFYYYSYKCFVAALMSMLSYAMANSIKF